jgi:hypothetical protein
MPGEGGRFFCEKSGAGLIFRRKIVLCGGLDAEA